MVNVCLFYEQENTVYASHKSFEIYSREYSVP